MLDTQRTKIPAGITNTIGFPNKPEDNKLKGSKITKDKAAQETIHARNLTKL